MRQTFPSCVLVYSLWNQKGSVASLPVSVRGRWSSANVGENLLLVLSFHGLCMSETDHLISLSKIPIKPFSLTFMHPIYSYLKALGQTIFSQNVFMHLLLHLKYYQSNKFLLHPKPNKWEKIVKSHYGWHHCNRVLVFHLAFIIPSTLLSWQGTSHGRQWLSRWRALAKRDFA